MKKFFIALILALVSLFALSGCFSEKSLENSSDTDTQVQQERMMKEANAQTGLPAITNFKEKKMLKMLYELRDREDLVCYAYLVNEINGEVGQYLGQCIGYGLPASTQYSNPEKVAASDRWQSSRNWLTMPQAEPNGLFMPEGLSATWLMMVDPETGDPRPVYIEPAIIVSPFKLHE